MKPIICYINTRIKCGQIIRLERGNNALSTDMKTEDDIYPQVTKSFDKNGQNYRFSSLSKFYFILIQDERISDLTIYAMIDN